MDQGRATLLKIPFEVVIYNLAQKNKEDKPVVLQP
jgi:hypothetical protein